MADDLVDDVFKVQCELLHRQVLTLWAVRGGGGLLQLPPQQAPGGLPLGLPPHNWHQPGRQPAPAWAAGCAHGDRSPRRARRSCHPQTLRGQEVRVGVVGGPSGSPGWPPMLRALPAGWVPGSPSSGSVPSLDPST